MNIEGRIIEETKEIMGKEVVIYVPQISVKEGVWQNAMSDGSFILKTSKGGIQPTDLKHIAEFFLLKKIKELEGFKKFFELYNL